MNEFDITYDNLTVAYNKIESMMGSIYEELQVDPTNERNVNLLNGLGDVALKVLMTQRDFVSGYGTDEFKEVLISNIESKMTVLSDALNKGNSK